MNRIRTRNDTFLNNDNHVQDDIDDNDYSDVDIESSSFVWSIHSYTVINDNDYDDDDYHDVDDNDDDGDDEHLYQYVF